ncbi:hypothetical protein GCM10010282_53920 [Streptomyces roseolus]|nr:acetylxylan esterase [Streptomyces roseolus]GGR54030.1 hypothetical protein GCM10010282_53920 [Streptomyces roseolus]
MTDHLLYASAGYAHLVVDGRGQGHDALGPHPDAGPHRVHGYMTGGSRIRTPMATADTGTPRARRPFRPGRRRHLDRPLRGADVGGEAPREGAERRGQPAVQPPSSGREVPVR